MHVSADPSRPELVLCGLRQVCRLTGGSVAAAGLHCCSGVTDLEGKGQAEPHSWSLKNTLPAVTPLHLFLPLTLLLLLLVVAAATAAQDPPRTVVRPAVYAGSTVHVLRSRADTLLASASCVGSQPGGSRTAAGFRAPIAGLPDSRQQPWLLCSGGRHSAVPTVPARKYLQLQADQAGTAWWALCVQIACAVW